MHIAKLLSIASAPIAKAAASEESLASLRRRGDLFCELAAPLCEKNGFYAFEGALHVFPQRIHKTGRGWFLQTDPIGYRDDVNLYAYVGRNPSNRVDPAGQARVQVAQSGTGAVYDFLPS